jgi:uncharacterized protein (UPF0264 family)
MIPRHEPTLLLASVTDPVEARLAAAGGANVIDAKNPHEGALGALPLATIAAIREAVPLTIPVSATIGDLPCEPDRVASAVMATAATGADYVKIGFFPGGNARAAIAHLATLDIAPARLVGLLLADREPDLALIPAMAQAGFAGVMLDTADKHAHGLTGILCHDQLAAFIAVAQSNGLFAGLAGSLRLWDVAPLMRLKPNILGFRGALCTAQSRTGRLSAAALAAVRAEIDKTAPGARSQPGTDAAE